MEFPSLTLLPRADSFNSSETFICMRPAEEPLISLTTATPVRWTASRSRLAWSCGVVLTLAVWLYVMWAYRGLPHDDPFITYRYASNVASGNGFVFNLGERVQSTTTPLFTLLLAGGSLLGIDIPSFAHLITAISLLLFGVCCVGFLSSSRREWAWLGLLAVALTYASPTTIYGLDSEMPLLMALAWGSWWAAARERWYLAALLAGLAAVTRGDGVLVGAAIALVYVAGHLKSDPRRWPWAAALLYAAVLAPWYIFAWFYFGSPLPASLGAKIAQGTTPGAVTFFQGLSIFWARSFNDVWLLWAPGMALLIVGFAAWLRRGLALAMPWVWAVLFVLGFGLLNVPRYPWYYSPLVPVAMLCLVFGGHAVGSFIARYTPTFNLARQIPWVAALLTCLTVGYVYFAGVAANERPEARLQYQLYKVVGEWLNANIPQDASVGAEEVGYLGYYGRRRIIDFVGLIQPDAAIHRARLEYLWPLHEYHPDYILALPPWMEGVGRDPWVQAHYSSLRTFQVPGSEVATLLKAKP